MAGYDGGVTALCTLALLNSGVPADDPVIRKALDVSPRPRARQDLYRRAANDGPLRRRAEEGHAAHPPQRRAGWNEHQVKEGQRKGAWSYPGPGGDNSNSQFAVLALYDAQRVGVEVSRETWELRRRLLAHHAERRRLLGLRSRRRRHRQHDVRRHRRLAICRGRARIGRRRGRKWPRRLLPARMKTTTTSTAHRLAGATFSVDHNPRPAGGGQPCLYYYLYGLERAGRLTARRFIGDHDWYREGAELLVREQDSLSHYWKGSWYAEDKPHISTRDGAACSCRRAAGRSSWPSSSTATAMTGTIIAATRPTSPTYTEEAWELGLTWQVMDPATATVEDLLQAPVLFISGSQAPELMQHAKKLRDYVDRGGFIFAEACCSDASAVSTTGFRQLMAAVFPEPEYQLQRLPPGHPIWRMQDSCGPIRPTPADCGASNMAAARAWSTAKRTCRAIGSLPSPGDGAATPRPSRSTSPTPWPSASTCSPTPPTASRRARSKAFITPTGRRSKRSEFQPRRHRNRQAPPRRRLQRRAGALLNLLRTARRAT